MPSKYLKRAMERRKLRKEKSDDMLPSKETVREDHAYMHARQTVKQ